MAGLLREYDGMKLWADRADSAEYDSEGNRISDSLATKQDTVSFDPNNAYNPTDNPAATVATVNNAVADLAGCTVTYASGALTLDFSDNAQGT